ncbi:hypothetical protein EV426DRAFT_579153 [Tirmania nivea]|nr:hypothetical protein EV426DRAFT_579153 [Tirmania nivea]
MEDGKFERFVQRTWEVIYIHKKAYILYQWYKLSDEQQRYYLELEEQEELPAFQIPKEDLEEIGIKENNKGNKGEKQVEANDGEKDIGEDEDEDGGEHDDEGGDDDEDEDQSEDEGNEVD